MLEGYKPSDTFPFDDSFILLVYARNFIDTFSFSFNAGQSDAGLTTPLYLILLSVVRLASLDLFTASYVIGKFFFLICAYFIYLLCRSLRRGHPDSEWCGIAAAIIWLTNGIASFNSLTGMECTFYSFLGLVLIHLFWREETPAYLLGLISACLLLTRPDGWFLVVPFLLFYFRRCYLTGKLNRIFQLLAVFCLLSFPWLAYCFYHNSTIFPNSVIAKGTAFKLGDSLTFIKDWFLFRQLPWIMEIFQSYSVFKISYTWLDYVPWAVFPISYLFLRRGVNRYSLPLLYILIHLAAYFIKRPYPGEVFRYFILDLAILIVYASVLIFELADFIRNKFPYLAKSLSISVVFAIMVLQYSKLPFYQNLYVTMNKRYYYRNHIMGYWFKTETPSETVIGLHDIGAIKFISNRQIVDLVGMIDPSVIEYRDGRLDELITGKCDYVVNFGILEKWGFHPEDTTKYQNVTDAPTERIYKVVIHSNLCREDQN